MSLPKNSAEVAVKLYDVACRLGVPATIQSSRVAHSDSRYLKLHPDTPHQRVIRISSHRPYENRYALCLGVHRPDLLRTAVDVGTSWMEKTYAHREHHDAAALSRDERAAELQDGGRGGDGCAVGEEADAPPRSKCGRPNRAGFRRPRRIRDAGAQPKWTSSEARRVRDQWDRDD